MGISMKINLIVLDYKKKDFTPIFRCLFHDSVILFYCVGRTVRLMPASIKHCSVGSLKNLNNISKMTSSRVPAESNAQSFAVVSIPESLTWAAEKKAVKSTSNRQSSHFC